MAICKFGVTVTGLRGTVGGLTFSANRSGPYCKAWAMPTLKTTAAVTVPRGGLTRYGPLWRGLTAPQRAAWRTWAADPAQARTNSLGATYYMTGFQAFCSINQCRLTVGLAVRSDAPTLARPSAPTVSAFLLYKTGSANTSAIGFPVGSLNGYYAVAFIALVNSVGNLDRGPYWRFVVDGLMGAADWFVLYQSGLEAAFGTVRVGQRGLLRFYKQNSEGYRSASATAQVNVAV